MPSTFTTPPTNELIQSQISTPNHWENPIQHKYTLSFIEQNLSNQYNYFPYRNRHESHGHNLNQWRKQKHHRQPMSSPRQENKNGKIIKVNLYRTQKSNSTWLGTTIKRLIIEPFKVFGLPVFYCKWTQGTARQNIQILDALNGSLGAAMESQKGSPLNYVLTFWGITGTKNLFSHHEDKYRIVDIIQKGSHYHISPIEEVTIKSNLEAMLLRADHKLARSDLNTTALEKAIYKEVEHG